MAQPDQRRLRPLDLACAAALLGTAVPKLMDPEALGRPWLLGAAVIEVTVASLFVVPNTRRIAGGAMAVFAAGLTAVALVALWRPPAEPCRCLGVIPIDGFGRVALAAGLLLLAGLRLAAAEPGRAGAPGDASIASAN